MGKFPLFFASLCILKGTEGSVKNISCFRHNSQVGPLINYNPSINHNLNMVASTSGNAQYSASDPSNSRAIHIQFVNNYTTEAPHQSFWSGAILDNSKIILRNNMMTVCILMLSLPTTIMNIYVYVTGRSKYSLKLHNPFYFAYIFCHFVICMIGIISKQHLDIVY